MKWNTADIEARANLIRPMTANTENLKARDVIQKKKRQKRTKQDSSYSSLRYSDLPKKIIIEVRDAIRRRTLEKGPYEIMHKINGKVTDDSV